MEAVNREGGGHAAKRLTAFGAALRQRRSLRARAGSPTRIRRGSRPSTPRGAGSTSSSSIPPITSAWRSASPRGCTARPGSTCAPAPVAKPVPGANVARSAGCYMAMQMEAGHQCPITMTNASVPTLLLEPRSRPDWVPKILARDYDKSFKPAGAKRGVTIGMGMTEKQGGTDVRANTTTATPAGTGGPGAEYIDHRAQVVHVGADVRRVPGAGAGAGRTVVLPDAALPARRHRQRAALPAPQGQARQSLQCLLGGGVPGARMPG